MRLASWTLAGGASSRLNATRGSLAATSVAPPVGCILGGPKSERNSPVLRALRQARHATSPQLGARTAPRQVSIQKNRHAKIFAKLGSHDKRLRTRGAPLADIEIDKRHDVERPHMWVYADLVGSAILSDVDAFNRHRAHRRAGRQISNLERPRA